MPAFLPTPETVAKALQTCAKIADTLFRREPSSQARNVDSPATASLAQNSNIISSKSTARDNDEAAASSTGPRTP